MSDNNHVNGISKELYQFIKTLPDEKVTDNVYEIICENEDGDITERKFGLNAFTDKAFSAEIVNNSNIDGEWTNYYGLRFVFGRGQGVPTSSDDELFDRIMELPIFVLTTYGTDTNSNYSARRCPDNEYLNTFNPTLNAIIGRRMTGIVTMDYNYDSIDENINITEFGEYGASGGGDSDIDWNKKPMHTHCLVYDENHDPSYFTKRINEKVTVKVYRSNIVYCSIFNKLWNQDKYLFINPMYMVRSPGTYSGDIMNWRSFVLMDQLSGRCRTEEDFPMYPVPWDCINDSGCYGSLGIAKNWGFGSDGDMLGCSHIDTGMNQAYNTTVEDGYRNTGTFPAYLYDDQTYSRCGIGIFHWNSLRNYYWYYNQHSGLKKHDWLFCIEKYNLNEPEVIQFDNAYTDDFLHPRFRNIFGLRHVVFDENGVGAAHDKNTLPVNDFHITSVKRYNYKTDAYDIVENFIDDPDYDFRNPERGIWGRYSIPEFGTFDVYVNIQADSIAITGFHNPDSESIWLTDSYWDSTTFVKLEHNAIVPQELQHKRYIIKQPTTDAWFNNNGRDGMGGGIFPIRESNKHAIVPSEQIEEFNIGDATINFVENPGWYASTIYSSDDGWVFVCGTLIYPESDDGTGNPYTYNLSVFNWTHMRYTHNRIITIDGDRYSFYQSPTSVTLKVYNIDPTHPEIDPNTTAVEYTDSDFKFEATGRVYVYIRDWCIFTLNEKTNHMIITRNTNILFIDFNDSTHNIINLPNLTGFKNGLAKAAGMIYGTDNIIIHPDLATDADNGVITFWVYSLTDFEIVKTITIERIAGATMTLHGAFGFKDMIYIGIYINTSSNHNVYMYNTSTDELIIKNGLYWNIIIDDNYVGKSNAIRSRLDFDDEVIFISAHYTDDNAQNNGCRTMAIFADDPTNPFYFESAGNNAYGSWYYMKNYSYVGAVSGLPRIGRFNDGKHLVVLFGGACSNYYNQYNTYVYRNQTQNMILDLGYIKNKGYHTPEQLCANIPSPIFRMPNKSNDLGGIHAPNNWSSPYRYDNNNTWFSEVTFYKGKVLVFTTYGEALLMPIDTFLPHQIIGTTRTVQAYNHPRYLNAYSTGFVIDKYNET